ncbi:MAG: NAD-dependent DNA ligase LigA [Endomicrobium sp.]|jgi:DNA ligase (NAD+)|nr:NAD-dependent DNA ligase LigA [Endomicrobium sp.]
MSKHIITRINDLRQKISYYDNLYYNHNTSEISDIEYDYLVEELIDLEHKYSTKYKSKPGFVPGKNLKICHLSKMLSLNKTYSYNNIATWYQKIQRYFNKQDNIKIICEPKIDGVGVSIIYVNGILISGGTRGTGTIGEDVTDNIKTISDIPEKLHVKERVPKLFELRGEVYMNKLDFIQLRKISKFTTARNATSGSLLHKSPHIPAIRKLHFYVHTFSKLVNNKIVKSQLEFLQFCKECGFKLQHNLKCCKSIEEILEYINYMVKHYNSLPYNIDGLVLKVNEFHNQQNLGCTNMAPRWAIAFKFSAKQIVTIITKIHIGIGLNGILTPSAILKPTALSGVTISKATLHNFDEIKRLNINEQDIVLLERAGDVIPKIVKVIKKKTTGFFLPPKYCPSCGTKITKTHKILSKVSKYICNNLKCKARLKKHLIHYASRNAMNIKGFGAKLIESLIIKDKIHTMADIYLLTYNDFLEINILKKEKINFLLEEISISKRQPLRKLIFALGIQHIGIVASETIAKHFKDMNTLLNASHRDFINLNNIGTAITLSLQEFVHNKFSRSIISKLIFAGVNIKEY